jgi:hypothetical protein
VLMLLADDALAVEELLERLDSRDVGKPRGY